MVKKTRENERKYLPVVERSVTAYRTIIFYIFFVLKGIGRKGDRDKRKRKGRRGE